MDTMSLSYLVNPKRKYNTPVPTYDSKYNDRILEMTKALLAQKQCGAVQEAFDSYVGECLRHFAEQDKEVTIPVRLECDTIMFPTKKINTFVKKKS